MKVIKNNTTVILKHIDNSLIRELSQFVISIQKEDTYNKLYKRLYKSKYRGLNIGKNESLLKSWLDEQMVKYTEKITTNYKEPSYNFMNINPRNLTSISYSFYIAPHPENMHEMIKKITQRFLEDDVSATIKYQKEPRINDCDRITIYTDTKNKDKVENSVAKVYLENPNLFIGAERAISWLYDTTIPFVYLSSENIKLTYNKKFITTIREAKDVFSYLYGVTNSKTGVSIKEQELNQVIDSLNIIFPSLLLRNGLLLNVNDEKIKNKDGKITTRYDYQTGILTNRDSNCLNSISANFFPTDEDRKYLLKNFYGIPSDRAKKRYGPSRKKVKP